MNKKSLLTILLFLLLLTSCKLEKLGKTITPSEYIKITRSVLDNTVALDIETNPSLMDNNEIIILTEKLPEGMNYVYDSASTEPSYSSDQTLMWLFTKNPPKTLGLFDIKSNIPKQIIYEIKGTPLGSFKGKWGLKHQNIGGLTIGGSQTITTAQEPQQESIEQPSEEPTEEAPPEEPQMEETLMEEQW